MSRSGRSAKDLPLVALSQEKVLEYPVRVRSEDSRGRSFHLFCRRVTTIQTLIDRPMGIAHAWGHSLWG